VLTIYSHFGLVSIAIVAAVDEETAERDVSMIEVVYSFFYVFLCVFHE